MTITRTALALLLGSFAALATVLPSPLVTLSPCHLVTLSPRHAAQLPILAAPAAPEALVDRVKEAIAAGIRHLRELENGKGNFEHASMLIARARPGGLTALATIALINAGVPESDPLIQRCLKFLRTLKPRDSYSVGLQTMAFCLAGEKQDRALVQRNLAWIKEQRMAGGWPYDAGMRKYGPDHSINQYVLLGLHEARLAGFTIDPELVKPLRDYYLGSGRASRGQWSYRDNPIPSMTMTTAGLCNLIITSQDLAGMRPLDNKGVDEHCGEYAEDVPVRQALNFLGVKYPNDIQRAPYFPHPFYCLYGIERAGRLTGQRFLEDKDWYRIGCEYLVRTQQKTGSWAIGDENLDRFPPVPTCFALLFLSKGRTPVLISKLAHGEVKRNGGEAWNNKRNDVRHVVEYVSRELMADQIKEAGLRPPLAWQVFDPRPLLKKTGEELAEELLQSPILYINGHDLTRVEDSKTEEMIRAFINNGGFIFAEACCGSEDFDKKFRALMKKVTDSELAPLGRDHPVWAAAGDAFKVPAGSFGVEGIQQGCKTVVIYSPKPISGWWENNDTQSRGGKLAFKMAANVVAYATGMQLPNERGAKVEIPRESTAPRPPPGYLKVAQLVFSRGATPLAPKAMPNLMVEIGRVQLEVNQKAINLTLAEDRLLAYKFFYLHDRTGFKVPGGDALENLRFTLENHGLLFADAACGSRAFDKSFRALVAALWPRDKFPDRQLVPIDVGANQAKNELYSKEVNGAQIDTVKCRIEEKDGRPSKTFQERPPQLEGVKINGRWAVIYSKYDIGCSLEKHQSTDCLGHDYDSAVRLGKAVVLYALRH